ncbi:MAG: hypothetical protein CMH57_12000 [Myxococcales bacterium]|nr:hypothetical protein [Myxococcales bacterium]
MRILLSETVDPDGAMCRWMSPDLEAMGHQVVVVPTQEAIHRLGVSGHQLLLLELVERWRPDLILVHPPYDHLNPEVCARLRGGGARLVTFAFDDDIFLDDWRASGAWGDLLEALRQMADLALTTSTRAAAASGGVVRAIRWAMSPPELPPASPQEPGRVVLVGRAYPGRVALVRRLAEANVPVLVRGHGWERQEPPGGSVDLGGGVDADTMWSLYRSGGVVLTTGGWEGRDVPMVKIRVLETAFAGACQVVAWSPDLGGYFTPEEVPSYRSEEELLTRLDELLSDPEARARCAAASRARALAEHTWETRFEEVLEGLRRAGRPARDSAPGPVGCAAYALLMQGLAITAEATRRYGAAAAFYGHASAAGAGVSARLGWCRSRFQQGAAAEAAAGLEALIGELDEAVHPGAARLHVHVNSPVVGSGLGVARLLSPGVEARAFWLSALARVDEAKALAALAAMDDDDVVVQVASLLSPEEGTARGFWLALMKRALAASPRTLRQAQRERAPGWRAWVEGVERDDA